MPKPRLREKDNVVSVFVGTLKSKKALATYLDEDDGVSSPFGRDLGVDLTAVEFIESSFSRPAAPADTVAGHLGASDYADAVTAAAATHGVKRSNAAIVIVDRAYGGKAGATFADGAVTFLGVFPYDV